MLTISLLGIAFIDSLNPSIILMTLFLLSTIKPLARVGSYVTAVFLTNLTLGLLVYFGLGATFSIFIERIANASAWWVYVLELVAAIALIATALLMRTDLEPKKGKEPKSLTSTATFTLGVGATFIEFTTAAPYLAAIALLTKANPDAAQAFLMLILYNIVYVGIPLFLTCFYIARREKAVTFFAIVREKSGKWLKHILRIVLLLLGGALLADFIGWTLGAPIF